MNRLKMIGIISAIPILLILIVYLFTGTSDGSEIFRREGCINCHSFKGQGGSAGPDLTAVTQRRSNWWIRNQIKNPKQHNPDSRMPEFRHLSWKEIQALINYLNNTKSIKLSQCLPYS